MKSPVFLPMAMMALLTMTSAMSLAFFQNAGDNCSPTVDHFLCDNWGDTECCYVTAPFCTAATLLDGDGLTHTTYFVNGTACTVTDEPLNFGRCVSAGACCLALPEGDENTDECSAYYHFGEPNPDPNNPPMPPKRDVTCRQPNSLVYTGDDGLVRKIMIPDGEFDKVVDVHSRRDYNALGRYATVGGGSDGV